MINIYTDKQILSEDRKVIDRNDAYFEVCTKY